MLCTASHDERVKSVNQEHFQQTEQLITLHIKVQLYKPKLYTDSGLLIYACKQMLKYLQWHGTGPK